MALMQLIARGSQNTYAPVTQAHEIRSYDLNKYNDQFNICLPRNSDTVCFLYLSFEPNNPNMTIEEFNQTIEHGKFDIIIGNVVISDYLSLYTKLKPVQKIDNIITIKLPFEYLHKELLQIACQCAECNVKVHNIDTSLFNNCSIITDLIFYNNQERRMYTGETQNRMIQMFETQSINSNNHIDLSFNLMSKGYFIEGDIDNISEIDIVCDNISRIKYNRLMIHLLCKKISNNLLYISFNNKDWQNCTSNSFVGSLNHGEHEFKMKITNNNNCEYKIHALSCNSIKYENGYYSIMENSTLNGLIVDPRNIIPMGQIIELTQNNVNRLPSANRYVIVWTDVRKKLSEDEEHVCIICQEDIGMYYASCSSCNNNYDYDSLKHWYGINKTCPLCRTPWINTNRYINEDDEHIETDDNDIRILL